MRQYAAALLKESGEESEYRRRAGSAHRYYQQSSRIKEELENKSKIANSLAQLALLQKNQGNVHTAVRLLIIAQDIFALIGSTDVAQIKQDLEILRETIGKKHFDELLREARSHPDAVIREVLSESQPPPEPE